MKKILLLLLTSLFLSGFTGVYAQKIKLVKGDLSFLKGQSELNIEYDYSDMAVGKFDNEKDYINQKKEDYNSKEPGRGDSWAEDWEADRGNTYEPKFQELFNKYMEKVGLSILHNSDAKYTMNFHTTFTEPGFNVGVWRGNAYIDAEIKIYETAKPENVLAVITVAKAAGKSFGGNDYDTEIRISESYAKCGKELAKFMSKKIK